MTTTERRLRLMHRARAQEIEIAFAHTPAQAFARGLELGAGDCYQSRHLKRYVADLICTDFDESLLNRNNTAITYGQCDAEEVDKVFSTHRFDLVFTSNMLSHTPNPRQVLRGIQSVTDDDAVLVFVVPNPLWKLTKLFLFYPLLLTRVPLLAWRYVHSRIVRQASVRVHEARQVKLTNNPKAFRRVSRWRERLLPMPVGAYPGNVAEVLGSRRTRWISELRCAGWQVVRVFKGPFIVGDMNEWWNNVCGRVGFSTENIYVACKDGRRSRYEAYFEPPGSRSPVDEPTRD